MGRQKRSAILYDGCFAHVFSRSPNQSRIFETEADFKFFLSLLFDLKTSHEFQIYHYVIMNTHFHLVASPSKIKAFSEALKLLKSAYTRWQNKRNRRNGPLWRDRFKSMVIENERYLYACGLYVEGNPVQAGMVAKAEDWPYSSAAHYLRGRQDPLINRYEIPELSKDINLADDKVFIKGLAIGSELFRLEVKEGIFA